MPGDPRQGTWRWPGETGTGRCGHREGADPDDTTRLAARWVCTPGPDGREHLELCWRVAGQCRHTRHGGAA